LSLARHCGQRNFTSTARRFGASTPRQPAPAWRCGLHPGTGTRRSQLGHSARLPACSTPTMRLCPQTAQKNERRDITAGRTFCPFGLTLQGAYTTGSTSSVKRDTTYSGSPHEWWPATVTMD
jgi:hypothetical protein